MRSLKVLIFTTLLICIFPLSAFAGIIVMINGTPLGAQDEPAFVSGKLMVPMRVIFENLGANVAWNNGVISATKDNTQIQLVINNLRGKLNNRPHILPVAPQIINGKTMVPLRFVGETLNAEVDYLHELQLVLITSDKYKNINTTTDNEFRKKVEKYKIYKNNTMSNEKTITFFKGIKNEFTQEFDQLKNYENKISDAILSKDTNAIVIANNNIANITLLKEDISKTVAKLNNDSLTVQLGKDIQAYCDMLNYVYSMIGEEKTVNDNTISKIKKANELQQSVNSSINNAEIKITEYVSLARSGSIR